MKTRLNSTVAVAALGVLFCSLAPSLAQATNTFPASGDVGIGTASPDQLLEVNGVSHLGNDLLLTRTDGGGTASITVDNSTTNTIEFQKAGGGNINNFTVSANASGFTGEVGIGTEAPAVSLDVSQKTDAIALPVGTTAQRPSSPANGMLRYNTSNNALEAYINGAWASIQ